MISLKNPAELDKMRKAGYIVAETLALMEEMVRPGITTGELNSAAEKLIRSRGARPLFLGYGGFPATICASVNEEVVHGIPGDRELKAGDIISIDTGAEINGFCGDAARTFAVGEIDPEIRRLLEITELSFVKGMEQAVAKNRLGDIGSCIQQVVEAAGFSVVRDYTGHGIGRNMHEEPAIPNYGTAGRGLRLANGMTLAIEPMVNMGTHKVITLTDGWTVVTKDRLPSAHYENTVAVTAKGPVILTSL
ncbi:MAG: type I methionyl aminopeptidase [Oscillospiraceae bacterium]|nr:type I methionyl aminopeptidase [Oscillospiraceae bacterium]